MQHDLVSVNSAAAINFLKKWKHDGPWVLTAIDSDKKLIATKTFSPETEKELEAWLAIHNGVKNIYFQVNDPIHHLSRKAKKQDVKCVRYFHLDIDPRPDMPIEKEQVRILELLTDKLPKTVPKPTAIVFSGAGFQAFWALETPIEINGDIKAAVEAEAYNKRLEKLFGGDNCHNIDRIMRLPGTLNIPDTKKRQKGRVPTLAKVLEFDITRVYNINEFAKAQLIYSSPDEIKTQNLVISTNALPVNDIEEVLKSFNAPDELIRVCKYGQDPENPQRDGDNSRSGWMFSAICKMVRYSVPNDTIYAIITDERFGISACVLDKKDPKKYAIREIEQAHEFIKSAPLILFDRTPLVSAREYVLRERPNLMHNNGDFLDYNGATYDDIEAGTIKSELYGFLSKQKTRSGQVDAPFNPDKNKVNKVIDALEAAVHQPRHTISPPCWLKENALEPKEILACKNGLLHLPSRILLSATPDFFTRNGLSYNYDSQAVNPCKWLRFLEVVWGDDPEAISALQEVFGYALTPDTSLQKIFLLAGPPRSGKGTIGRMLSQVIGQKNVCSPTLNSMGDNFGLEPLIGKQLALISDMRIGKKTDQATAVENLLRISGEDALTINRKYKSPWHGFLPVRFFIMTNEIPRLIDSSGALANRFVPLVMTNSFLGKENPNLANELKEELPAILNWAIEGWLRLQARGYFLLPESSKLALQEISDLASPISTFIRDECVLEPAASIEKLELYEAYKKWSQRQGQYYTSENTVFGRDLMAVLRGKIKSSKLNTGEMRVPHYVGIKLKKYDRITSPAF